MIFESVINRILLEGKVKVYNRSTEFHVTDNESALLLIKVTLDEYSLHTHATVTKENVVLAN